MASGNCLDEDALSRIREIRSDAFLAGLIDLFIKEAPLRIEEAWLGGKAGDMKKTALAAHTLQCLAGNVGALTIGRLAAEAETAAAGQEAAPALSLLLFELEIAFAETRSCLLTAREGLSA